MAQQSDRSARKYDVILWGATGFTGSRTAHYLASNAPKSLKWALGGRSENKLGQIRSEVLQLDSSWEDTLGVVTADSSSLESLEQLAGQTKVVISTVGPFARHGSLLVEACVRSSTDYCDITGETLWVKKMIEKFHDQAVANNALIVNFCGFDSVPSDMGAFMMTSYIKNKYNKPTKSVKMTISKMKMGLSGGTIHSGINMVEEATDMKELNDPYMLNPVEFRGPEKPYTPKAYYDKDFGSWQGLFFMSQVNEKVVRRSNGITGNSYGENFTYRETQTFSAVVGHLVTCGHAIFERGVTLSPVRWLLKKVVPAQGEGPSEEQIKKGFFTSELVAEVDSDEKIKVRGKIHGSGDPGYSETCKYVAEAAITMALSRSECRSQGGVLTPASGLGQVYLDRLRAIPGAVFEVME
ncbi:saccharopine dehydrogenase [Basidiobolus meristosporus CBS 931.73]|uniref:Saccharopine dehydrogenase n=1 Tax=Basidiobolus meristosporus CBS 931.73 TaxID=1314790 RepID=A0A1Y1YNI6_9FUNG|nr:saccharopine dehydrogenase [Basidiobolus meristosporus CBS 931.73]|eukprot:ORX99326.1 saccharopine dehydrogenase [Basidiobolus meristosporus CBS 931.73]